MPRTPRPGKDCFLYYSTAYDTPSLILIAQAVDVSQPGITKGKVAVPSRDAQGWNPKLAGLKEMNLEFGYLYEADVDDDDPDTVFTALRNAYLNDTPLVFYVMDGSATLSGNHAEGWRFPGIVFDFPTSEELESGKTYDIGVEFTRMRDGSDALILPDWYEVDVA
jgi:hypothetical protein